MWENLDLRKFPRFAIKCDIEISGTNNPLSVACMTTNISAGGVCVVMPKEVSKLTRVLVRLYLPGDDAEPVESYARVCWVVPSRTPLKNEILFDTGFEFINIQDKDRDRIKKFITSHQQNS